VGLVDRIIWVNADYPFSYSKYVVGNVKGTSKAKCNSSSSYLGDGERIKKTQQFGYAQFPVTL
jgi:hypothetical protein